jgi:hypothetical protein
MRESAPRRLTRNRGGARPGAGRPTKRVTLLRQTLRETLGAKLDADAIGPIIDILLRMALEGDIDAIKIVLDRALGKVKETVEVQQTPVKGYIVVGPDDL